MLWIDVTEVMSDPESDRDSDCDEGYKYPTQRTTEKDGNRTSTRREYTLGRTKTRTIHMDGKYEKDAGAFIFQQDVARIHNSLTSGEGEQTLLKSVNINLVNSLPATKHGYCCEIHAFENGKSTRLIPAYSVVAPRTDKHSGDCDFIITTDAHPTEGIHTFTELGELEALVGPVNVSALREKAKLKKNKYRLKLCTTTDANDSDSDDSGSESENESDSEKKTKSKVTVKTVNALAWYIRKYHRDDVTSRDDELTLTSEVLEKACKELEAITAVYKCKLPATGSIRFVVTPRHAPSTTPMQDSCSMTTTFTFQTLVEKIVSV